MSKKYPSKSSWASDDDASNLLGSILDDTRDAALAETQELAQAVEAKRQAEADAKRLAEQQRRADTASRLEKEAARQATLEKRRTAAMQAIMAADAPVKHEPQEVAPSIAPMHEPSLPEVAMEPLAAVMPLATPTPVAQPAPSHWLMWIAAAAAALVVVSGAALASALLMPGYKPDPTPYPKLVMHPTLTRDLVSGEAFRPIPEEEVPEVKVKEHKPKRTGKARPGTTRPAKPRKPNKPSFDEMFGNSDDIFGTMDKPGK